MSSKELQESFARLVQSIHQQWGSIPSEIANELVDIDRLIQDSLTQEKPQAVTPETETVTG